MKDINNLNIIQKIVKDYYNTPEISGKSRKRELVHTRQVICYFARRFTKLSLSEIGKEIGNKNHATVIYGYKTIKDIMTGDKQLREDIKIMESKIDVKMENKYSASDRRNFFNEIIKKNLKNDDISITVQNCKTSMTFHSSLNPISLKHHPVIQYEV